jgi:hypothetical protein
LALFLSSDLWLILSPAAVVTVETSIAVAATFVSPLAALTRLGTNNISLGTIGGFSQDLNFSVVSESGLQGAAFTIRIVQAAARNSTGFSVNVSGPDGFSATVIQQNSAADRSITLPASAAGGSVSLLISLTGGATVLPAILGPTISLGARGSVTFYPFTVTSENKQESCGVLLSFTVALLSLTSWNATIQGGLASTVRLSSDSALQVNTIQAPIGSTDPIALNASTLTFWLSGDNCQIVRDSLGFSAGIGVASDLNLPRARYWFASWIGPTDSDIYIYGQSM